MEMPAVSAVDCAYLAGFFDGEGCASIHRYPAWRHYRVRYAVELQLSNTDEEVIRWAQTILGGSIQVREPGKCRSRRVLYQLCASCVTAYTGLQLLLPYLRVKREQALLCIEFHERFFNHPDGWRRFRTDEERDEMHRYYLAVKALKKPVSSA